MATCKLGDTIIGPPTPISGHVTHHDAGCAGLYRLRIIHAPIDLEGYIINFDALNDLAKKELPKLITISCSPNLFEHPVKEARMIAHGVGTKVMFDATH